MGIALSMTGCQPLGAHFDQACSAPPFGQMEGSCSNEPESCPTMQFEDCATAHSVAQCTDVCQDSLGGMDNVHCWFWNSYFEETSDAACSEDQVCFSPGNQGGPLINPGCDYLDGGTPLKPCIGIGPPCLGPDGGLNP